MVVIPNAINFFSAFGPIPLILRTGSGQIRLGISSSFKIVTPSGLFRSDPILASNLFGVIAIEQVKPVAAITACLIRIASA